MKTLNIQANFSAQKPREKKELLNFLNDFPGTRFISFPIKVFLTSTLIKKKHHLLKYIINIFVWD